MRMRIRPLGLEFYGPEEALFRLFPFPVPGVGSAERIVGFGRERVEFNRLLSRGAQLFDLSRYIGFSITGKRCVSCGQRRVCRGEGRIFGDSLLEQRNALTTNRHFEL